MLASLTRVRREERRNVWAAFFMLLGLIGSHMVLETARDALFLASVPASRLPIVYIGIALVSLLVTQVQLRVSGSLNRRRALSIWTGIAALVTLSFWLFIDRLGQAGFYALYIWSGVLTTLVLVHFWVLLGDIFTVTQAKRVYSLIGTGSVLGAIAGSALSGLLSPMLGAENLLLLSSVGFLLTSIIPLFLEDVGKSTADDLESRVRDGLGDALRYIVGHPYTRTIVVLVVLSTATVTLGDFIFKATVADLVAPEDLSGFFAWVYFATNVISLFAQLWLVTFILKRFDIAVALTVLPAILILGAVGMAIVPGLVAALLIKGADGSLRHSLNRTVNELLFVPLTDRVRGSVKAFVDVVGQRGGQAMVSLLILALGAFGATLPLLAGVLALLASGWCVCAIFIRRHYLDVFRGRLYRGEGFSAFPDLDMASLETLISALDSGNENEVVAALDVLETEGKPRLVPSFILYHPSERIVDRALAMFVQSGRTNVAPAAARLLEHPSEHVRAGAVAATSILAFDERKLRLMLSHEESAVVRASIMANLIASGKITGSDARDALNAIIEHGESEVKIALIQAIAGREAKNFDDTLTRLAADRDSAVQLSVARAVGKLHSRSLLPVLLNLLINEDTRSVARTNLVAFGREGLEYLTEAFCDPTINALARWQIPSTLVMFGLGEEVAPILLQRVTKEPDGMVRYRSILALENIVEDSPQIELDHAILDEAIALNVARAYRYLDRRVALERGAAALPKRNTEGYALLRSSLQDKEINAIDRVFRLLGLAYRTENFEEIREGLDSGNVEARASSIELIENIIAPPLRGAIVGLIDDVDDSERLTHSRPYHSAKFQLDYEELLRQIVNDNSDIAIRAIAVYHIGELGVAALRPELERIIDSQEDRSATEIIGPDVALALERISMGATRRSNAEDRGGDSGEPR